MPCDFPGKFLAINQFSPRLSIASAACRRRIGQRAKKWLKVIEANQRLKEALVSRRATARGWAYRGTQVSRPREPLDGARWLGFRDTKLVSAMRAGGSAAPACARVIKSIKINGDKPDDNDR